MEAAQSEKCYVVKCYVMLCYVVWVKVQSESLNTLLLLYLLFLVFFMVLRFNH